MKIRQEQSEKERLKDNFKQRLEMNNIHWEENLVGVFMVTVKITCVVMVTVKITCVVMVHSEEIDLD